jgi:hypothetical protein
VGSIICMNRVRRIARGGIPRLPLAGWLMDALGIPAAGSRTLLKFCLAKYPKDILFEQPLQGVTGDAWPAKAKTLSCIVPRPETAPHFQAVYHYLLLTTATATQQ